uniref:Interleukin 19 like n=1 Tax=Myripristis murdjan TaxID=586833 RepID=A0A668AF64_9TELE
VAMKVSVCSLSLLLLLSCGSRPVESRRLHLGSCAVTVHIHELRQYYADIRPNAVTGDNELAVKLLEKSLMNDIQEGDRCCFLGLLLRFYVERVFNNYTGSESQHQRSVSALANAFISIRRDIKLCVKETLRKIDSLHAEFIKLDTKQAAVKAVGELHTVLDWLETTHT